MIRAGCYRIPRKPKRATPERDLHLAVVDLLDRTAMPGVLWWSTNNNGGGKMTIQAARRLKQMGQRPGLPDFMFLTPFQKHLQCMELKSADGRQSEEQIEWALAARLMGHRYEIARSLEEAAEYLADFGAIRPVVSGRADVRRRVA